MLFVLFHLYKLIRTPTDIPSPNGQSTLTFGAVVMDN